MSSVLVKNPTIVGGGEEAKLYSLSDTIYNNTTTKYSPSSYGDYNGFSDVSITTNISVPLGTKNITENGTYNASDDGYTGYTQVDVNIPLKRELNISKNGEYRASEDGYAGYKIVNVNVYPAVTGKVINAPGSYYASDDHVDGYSQVDVNIWQYANYDGSRNVYISNLDGNNRDNHYMLAGVAPNISTLNCDAVEVCSFAGYARSNLRTINFNARTQDIKSEAFRNCGITQLTLPSTIQSSVGQYAFKGCNSLSSVTYDIPGGEVTISSQLFEDCTSLQTLYFDEHASVNSVGDGARKTNFGLAFKGVDFTSLTVSPNNPYLDARDNCNALIDTATNTLLLGSERSTIPASVTSIGNSAFYQRTNLTSIDLSHIYSIGNDAFYWTGLTTLTIPNNVSTIGHGAFSTCQVLTTVVIPDSITVIPDGCFSQCVSLANLTIPNTIVTIDDYAFQGCYALNSFTIPASVTKLGGSIFNNDTSLTEVSYDSTISDWNNIDKISQWGTPWNQGSSITVVHCTDGDINL